jgi:hypothetical protein
MGEHRPLEYLEKHYFSSILNERSFYLVMVLCIMFVLVLGGEFDLFELDFLVPKLSKFSFKFIDRNYLTGRLKPR